MFSGVLAAPNASSKDCAPILIGKFALAVVARRKVAVNFKIF